MSTPVQVKEKALSRAADLLDRNTLGQADIETLKALAALIEATRPVR